MRQVALLSFLYKPHVGGVENSLESLAKVYSDLGNPVKVFCTDAPKSLKLTNSEIINSVQVERFHWNDSLILVFPLNLFYNIVLLAIWLKRRIQNDTLAISRHHIMCLALALIGRDYTYLIPEVVMKNSETIKSMPLKARFIMWVNHRFQKIAISRARKNLVFSENVKQQLYDVGINANADLVKPGVDIDKFKMSKADARKRLGLNQKDIYLLGLGRMINGKGFDYAIKTLKYILDFKVKLLLVGDGPHLFKLKELANKEGGEDRVLFMGKTNTPELYFIASDIFLMTSINEAFGQTILEAVFAKKPIVAFNNGKFENVLIETATKEILGNRKGVYYTDPDVISLFRTIEEVIKDHVIPNQNVSHLDIEEEYSWKKLALMLVR